MSTKRYDLKSTPSIQHAAVLIGNTVEETAENMRRMKRSRPPYRLTLPRQLIGAVLGAGSAPERAERLAWALRQADAEPNALLRKATKEIVECFGTYLEAVEIKWFRPRNPTRYLLGKDHYVPVNPLGAIGDGKVVRLVWPQMWRSRTLNPFQFSLVGAVLERQVFEIEPEITELEWLELSAPAGSEKRELRVRDRTAYQPLSDDVVKEALERLVLAYEIVRAEPQPERKKPKSPTGDLFDLDA